jgi:hypothetical protein
MNLSIGGRYCSMITVDRGKASVLERRTAKTATAGESGTIGVNTFEIILKKDKDHRFPTNFGSSARSIPIFSEHAGQIEGRYTGTL